MWRYSHVLRYGEGGTMSEVWAPAGSIFTWLFTSALSVMHVTCPLLEMCFLPARGVRAYVVVGSTERCVRGPSCVLGYNRSVGRPGAAVAAVEATAVV